MQQVIYHDKVKKQDLALIIREISNARLDYYIPVENAQALYQEGKLFIISEPYTQQWAYGQDTPGEYK